ncbi:MAG: PIN domain-containing protein [Methanocalculus sp. MSAO_Arc1]|uniref:type II toxin-antitoxin system VapC family toxin n=1 Tax=Methanocalculus sp. MSAO_Arc1 TaxID=2293854 RepID=UPI000FF1F532|nr:PIN domain-containing protein [Methanocalculus sp. MSAO_Arc1]RQD81821.1 MAG: PIN domain-containing protein [Methanocalculus sp. MSAO_Arc1]
MKNNLCFVDTVCWIALLNRKERFHEKTDKMYKNLMKSGYYLLTTSAVLDETANALSDPLFKPAVIKLFQKIEKSSRVEITFVDDVLWSKGWELYRSRLDKGWSLTDCISFEVMRESNIREALTRDHHFEQAGYKILL